MKPTLRDWLVSFLFLLIMVFGLGYMTESAQREEVTYNRGFLAGKAEVMANIKEHEAEIAVQWWVGSTDMVKVRQRICANVSQNAFKTEVKK